MGNGTGTEAGLVGEDTSGYAAFHAGEEASDNAAGYCLRMEGTLKDHGKYQWNTVCVKQDYAKGQQDVKQCHEGNQFFCYISDSLYAAQENQGYQSSQHNAGHEADNRF